MRLIISVVLGLIAYAVSLAIGYPELTRRIILVLIIGMIVGGVSDALAAVLQGQENMVRLSASLLLDRSIASVGTIGLIFLHASLPVICTISIVTNLVGSVVKYRSVKWYGGSFRFPNLHSIWSLASAGLPFLGWSVFRNLYGETDPLVLGFVTSDTKIGWYSLAFRLIAMTLFFPATVSGALLPSLSVAHSTAQSNDFSAMSRRMMSLVMLVGVPAGLLLVCMPAPILALLHYPPSFSGSVPVIRAAGVSLVLYFLGIVLGAVVVASDRQAKMLRASVIGACIGLPSCFLFARIAEQLWGNAALGAMASDILLEVILIWLYLAAIPPGVFAGESASQLFRFGLAGVPMALLLISPWGLHAGLWMAPPAILMYCVSCIILKAFPIDDVRGAIQMIRQHR